MPQEQFTLINKVALVTGAGGGIGRAICKAFADAGASVACADLNPGSAEATAKAIPSGKSISITCDVASESETRAAVDRTVETFGGLHILVNGAACNDPSGSVLDYDLAMWNKVFAVNVGGALLMSKWSIPHMVRAGGGSIIHIASQLGSVAAQNRVAYCSTKGTLIQMAKAMAADHAAQGIRVNTLSPGATETERLVVRFGNMENARKLAGPKHLLGRLGQPEEIATAAVFLASNASSFMTGADLLVDGGYNAW